MSENPMGFDRMIAGLGELDAIHKHLDRIDLAGMTRVIEWLRDPADSDITDEFNEFMKITTGQGVEDILARFEQMVTAAKEFKAVMDRERS